MMRTTPVGDVDKEQTQNAESISAHERKRRMVKRVLGMLTAIIMAGVMIPLQKVEASSVTVPDDGVLYEVNDADNLVIGEKSFVGEFVSDNVKYPYVLRTHVMADSTTILQFDIDKAVTEKLHTTSDFGKITFSARQFYEDNFEGNNFSLSYAGVGEFDKVTYPDNVDPYLLKLDNYTLLSDVDTIPNEFSEELHATEDTQFMLRIMPTYDDAKLAGDGDYYQLHISGKTYEVQCKADENGKLYADIIEVENTGDFDFDSFTAPHYVELGDVNGDNTADIMDVITVNKALLGGAEITDDMITAVDFDRNGLDTTDSLNLLKYIVEMVDKGYLQNIRDTSLR